MFVSFVANLFHEFVGDLGSLVWPGGMRGAITIKYKNVSKPSLKSMILI